MNINRNVYMVQQIIRVTSEKNSSGDRSSRNEFYPRKTRAEKIIRHQLFSALSPHTTRLEARSCGSCHRNDQALGIIDKHVTHPDHPEWILPRGWIDDGQDKPGESSNPRARSLNLSEIQKIRRVGNCLPCHHQEERFFQDFKSWRSDLPEDHPPL